MPRPPSVYNLNLRDTQVRDHPHPRGPRHKKVEPYRWVVPAYPNRPNASRVPWKCSNISSGGMSKWPHHRPALQTRPVIMAQNPHKAYRPPEQAWRRFQG